MNNKELELTDEQVRKEVDFILIENRAYSIVDKEKAINQILALFSARQAEAVRKERERILLWGIEPCFEHSQGGVFTRRECPKCWQVLSGEVVL